jgi:hypothetical protein
MQLGYPENIYLPTDGFITSFHEVPALAAIAIAFYLSLHVPPHPRPRSYGGALSLDYICGGYRGVGVEAVRAVKYY